MCEQCEGLAERLVIRGGEDYKRIAAQLIAMVDRGSLQAIAEWGGSLHEVVTSPTWPDDLIVQTLECTKCRTKFELSADTYHGRADWTWQDASQMPSADILLRVLR